MENQSKAYVIARCFGDEPRRVLCERAGSGYHVALSANGERIGFPADYLFKDDAALYRELKAAFDGGQKNELCRLWERAQAIH